MNVQKTCAAIVAALIIWFVAISVAMAEPPPGGQTPAPAKEPTCEEKLASATADRDAMLQDPACKAALEQKSNPQPQPPKPKRFDIVCGFGTTGGQPTVLDRSTGSFHCTCKDPDADALVTGPTGASGKSEICLPKKQGSASSTTVVTTSQITKICGEGTTGVPSSNGNCVCADPAHKVVTGPTTSETQMQICIDTSGPRPPMRLVCDPSSTTGQPGPDGHCSCSDSDAEIVSGPFSEEEGIRIEKCIRGASASALATSDLQLFAGVVAVLGGRNGFVGGAGLVAGLLGWPSRYVGLTVEVTVSANYEAEDADQLGTLFAVEGGVGPSFRPIDGFEFALLFYGKQWNRVDARGAGLEGNNLGYQFGGGVSALIQPWTAPIAIKIGGNLGYGSVAGTVGGTATEAPMVQGGFQLGLVFTDGFNF